MGRRARRELGGIPGQLAVAGWSAGGNVAAVVSHLARDAGGPAIAGQLLINPVTDCDLDTSSYLESADGYVLTKSLMEWFWDHYADPDDRSDPRASPLRADDLAGLPPAFIVTSEFDPLRDEGLAYAAALEAAGVPVDAAPARGQIHTSLTMVDVILSGAPAREEMVDALKLQNLTRRWPLLEQGRPSELLWCGRPLRSEHGADGGTGSATEVVRSVCPYCAVGCGQIVRPRRPDRQHRGQPRQPDQPGHALPQGRGHLAAGHIPTG